LEQTLGGLTYTLDVNLSDSVDSMMDQLQAQAHIPKEQMRFIFGGKQLIAGDTLAFCGIQRERCGCLSIVDRRCIIVVWYVSTLHLVLRLRGQVNEFVFFGVFFV